MKVSSEVLVDSLATLVVVDRPSLLATKFAPRPVALIQLCRIGLSIVYGTSSHQHFRVIVWNEFEKAKMFLKRIYEPDS